MITLFEQSKPGRTSLVTSASLHVIGIVALMQFGSAVLVPPVHRKAATLVFIPQPPVQSKPVPPLPTPKIRAFRLPQKSQPAPVETARRPALIEAPVIATAPAPPAIRPMPAIRTQEPPPQIRTGVLEALHQPAPARPAATVQVGAFTQKRENEPKLPVRTTTRPAGFDNAAAPQKSENEPGKSVSTGAFGGTAVARVSGTQRSISGAGFGSAETATRVRSTEQTARAGFGDTITAKPQAPVARQATAQVSDTTPVEITFKPRPAYTDEARRAGIEGEILLETVFSASGEVRVLRIVRGLPHGLNEMALAAAQAIRFRPALRHGQAIDMTATVRMNFELAN